MKNSLWDSHVHIFPNRLFNAIWDWFQRAGWNIPYSYLEYREITETLQAMGVEKAFLLTYAHKPDMSLALNRWVQEFCLANPMFIPFGCVHPDDSDLPELLTTVLDDWDFAGFKLQLAVQGFAADDKRLDPVYEALDQRGKILVVHAGTAPYAEAEHPFLGVERLKPALLRFPRMKILLPHLGLYELEPTLEMLARFPNLYLDTAWVLGNPAAPLAPEKIGEVIAAFPDRILYGSDFPLLEYAPQIGVEALENLSLAEDILAGVLRDNARRLLER
jgi:predicted TIM-barrel fold metal-dependent hydrolase